MVVDSRDEIIYRQADIADLKDIIRLVRDSFDEFVAESFEPKGNFEFYQYLENDVKQNSIPEGTFYYIAEAKGNIIGVIKILSYGKIGWFFVDGKYHGKGIGKKLYNLGEKLLKDSFPNVTEIEVNSSIFAKNIYKALGFKVKSSVVNDNGAVYIPMIKHL